MSEQKNHLVTQLTDADLKSVTGGLSYHATKGGKYYKWVGGNQTKAYLCPNCGRPVHKGALWRWYCDPCNKSWYYEDSFSNSLDLSSGLWQEISADEYSHWENVNDDDYR